MCEIWDFNCVLLGIQVFFFFILSSRAIDNWRFEGTYCLNCQWSRNPLIPDNRDRWTCTSSLVRLIKPGKNGKPNGRKVPADPDLIVGLFARMRCLSVLPVGARFFAHVQTRPGTHPASCTMGNGSFPGVKRPGRGACHPPPSSAEVKNEWSYTSTPPLGLRGILWGELYLDVCPHIFLSKILPLHYHLLQQFHNHAPHIDGEITPHLRLQSQLDIASP
jgi:hypothetical protein